MISTWALGFFGVADFELHNFFFYRGRSIMSGQIYEQLYLHNSYEFAAFYKLSRLSIADPIHGRHKVFMLEPWVTVAIHVSTKNFLSEFMGEWASST